MKALIAILLFFQLSFNLHAQVNAYAQVTSISSTTITIGSSNESYGTFITGLPVIVMQMQDNTIGSNILNTVLFGTLSSIQSTGTYEIARISSVSRTPGLTQVTLSTPLSNTYNIGSNSSVQLISYPLLSAANYTTVADITAVPWNGATGGVVAFRVGGTLTLNHNITADNAGFRGGAVNGGGASNCDAATYISAAGDNYANKGESIYKVSNNNFIAGRGRILNGGGGGNNHNAGGGGGSNIAGGGDGGKGYGCSSSAGGLGGSSMSLLVGSSRVFMGGGAGAGEANNSYNSAGGNGGGIVIISANEIKTTGTGSALRISANGQTASDVGNDGAGGGGAGGSVLLSVTTWTIASTKLLNISSNGGSGGNVTDVSSHGGGGGGGQGAVIFSTLVVPTSNITTKTLNGTGGRNYAGGTFADNGAGLDNVGIFTASFGLLPQKMISFKAKKSTEGNALNWQMANDDDVDYYEVQRSFNGSNFETIGTVQRQETENNYTDHDPLDKNIYYRLVIHDKYNHIEYTSVVIVKSASTSLLSISLMPNPVSTHTSLKIETARSINANIRIVNSFGMVVSVRNMNLVKGENSIALTEANRLSTGVYEVVVNAGNNSTNIKMLVTK